MMFDVALCSVYEGDNGMGHSPELNDFQHSLIIGCHLNDIRDISVFLIMPKSNVSDVIKWEHGDTTVTQPRPGRLLMTERDY